MKLRSIAWHESEAGGAIHGVAFPSARIGYEHMNAYAATLVGSDLKKCGHFGLRFINIVILVYLSRLCLHLLPY